MNKEYTIVDSKVIIADENGKKRKMDYQDNIDELLAQENLIEETERKLEELKRESEEFNHEKSSNWLAIVPALTTLVVPTIVFVGLRALLNIDQNTFPTPLLVTAALMPLGICYSLLEYKKNKDAQKEEIGRQAVIEYLSRNLEKQKEYLEELKRERTIKNKPEDWLSDIVNDKERLNNLKAFIRLYMDCGANLEKYYDYYQKHSELPRRVQKNYSEYGRELITEFLEENGPKLSRRKK